MYSVWCNVKLTSSGFHFLDGQFATSSSLVDWNPKKTDIFRIVENVATQTIGSCCVSSWVYALMAVLEPQAITQLSKFAEFEY